MNPLKNSCWPCSQFTVTNNNPYKLKDNKMDKFQTIVKTKIFLTFSCLLALVIMFLLYTTFVVGWDFAPYYYDFGLVFQKLSNLWKYGTEFPELVYGEPALVA